MTTDNSKGDCYINDAMGMILILAARHPRAREHSAAELLDRLHRADADGLFDGKIWGNMSEAEWAVLQANFFAEYV